MVFSDDLFRRIARLGAERRIDPENDAVGIGNDDTVGGSLERRTLEAQLLLRLFALGDVPDRCQVNIFPSNSILVKSTSAGNSSPLIRVCVHSKKWEPSRMAISIISPAFSAELRPSGCRSGDNSRGP